MTACFGWGARAVTSMIVGLASCSVASAGFSLYDEHVDGDLSNDWLSPTQLTPFTLDSNLVSLHVVNSNEPEGDRDYFTITIPNGYQLDSIILPSVDAGGGDAVAFLGIQAGDQITVDPNFPNPEPLLGWMLTQESFQGQDILPILVGEENTPLGAGQYSFWAQQTGQDLTSLLLNFQVSAIPSPSTFSLVALALCGAARRRR